MSAILDQLKEEVRATLTPTEEAVANAATAKLDTLLAEAQAAHDAAKARFEELASAKKELEPAVEVPSEPVEEVAQG